MFEPVFTEAWNVALLKLSQESSLAMEEYLKNVPEDVLKDYVLETEPMSFFTDKSIESNDIKIMVEQKYRLRLKTKEERDSENFIRINQDLLKENPEPEVVTKGRLRSATLTNNGLGDIEFTKEDPVYCKICGKLTDYHLNENHAFSPDLEEVSPFERDLSSVLNRHSQENESGTPDFILAQYLKACLTNFNIAVQNRAQWRGENAEFPLPATGRLNFNQSTHRAEPNMGFPGDTFNG